MFAISCKKLFRFSPNSIARLQGGQIRIMKGGEDVIAEKYLMEKERLSRALNGQENLDGAVTAITDALKEYNLNLMPGTAFDVMRFTLETIHLQNYDAPERKPGQGLG